MYSRTVSDYDTPYDIMTGLWAGVATTYDPKGKYLGTMRSRLAVYWKKPHTLMHFRQDVEVDGDEMSEGDVVRKSPTKLVRLDFDLEVDGNYARGSTGGPAGVEIIGTKTRSDHYHFHLRSNEGSWYNNHHFMGPDERHILGPFIGRDGEIAAVVAQTFNRMSHDVPTEYIREPQQ
jgi:hypothetical protein